MKIIKAQWKFCNLLVCRNIHSFYQESLCQLPGHNCSRPGESLPYYVALILKYKFISRPHLHLHIPDSEINLLRDAKSAVLEGLWLWKHRRINVVWQGTQHFYLYYLLILVLQHERKASSMHVANYQFSIILSTELNVCINLLINIAERNPCLAVRKHPASPVNMCPGPFIICMCVWIYNSLKIECVAFQCWSSVFGSPV